MRFSIIPKYIAVFTVTLALLFALTVGCALIPREAVQPQFEETGEYLCERNVRYLLVDFVQASRIDRYADCVTLAIANYLDEEHPIQSAMWASYYGDNSALMNTYLLEGASSFPEANQEYLRYWHGAAAVLRLLHLFWNVKEIYIINAILITALLLILLFLLVHKNYYGESIAIILAMTIVSIWYVPFCLEYTYMFLCMLPASIIGVVIAERRNYQQLTVFFLVVGMMTAYFDFLTTETITLLIPLLLILRIRQRQRISNAKEDGTFSIKCCFAALRAYLWVKSVAEMPVKPLHC